MRELEQPLLIHRPKKKPMPGGKVRRGAGGPRAPCSSACSTSRALSALQPQLDMVLLLPELTFLTGISEIKKDARMLKVSIAHLVKGWRCRAAPHGCCAPRT